MPTAPLPLFQALLTALQIPLNPPTISAIPPSLLLLVLERILGARVPLPSHLRRCTTHADELGLVKCLMGIMADDELGMDLTAVEPGRVVAGGRDEMGVMILALVVIAKRRGVVVGGMGRGAGSVGEAEASFDSVRTGWNGGSVRSRGSWRPAGRGALGWGGDAGFGTDEWDGRDDMDAMDTMDVLDGDVGTLPEPLEPDFTLSSPILPSASTSTFASLDVFGQTGTQDYMAPKTKHGLFGHNKADTDADADLDGEHHGHRLGQTRGVHAPGSWEEGNWTVDHYDPDGQAYETPMPRHGLDVPLVRSGPEPTSGPPKKQGQREYEDDVRGVEKGMRQRDQGPMARDLRDTLAYEKVASWREDSLTTATTATSLTLVSGSNGHRTVLQEMMDEFGLG